MNKQELKKQVLEIRDECIKVATQQDSQRMQKTAQLILAASGLKLLENKIKRNGVF